MRDELYIDDIVGEWAVYSRICNRVFYGTTREKALERRAEAERVAVDHARKCPQDSEIEVAS